jgi:hypothetical protein
MSINFNSPEEYKQALQKMLQRHAIELAQLAKHGSDDSVSEKNIDDRALFCTITSIALKAGEQSLEIKKGLCNVRILRSIKPRT